MHNNKFRKAQKKLKQAIKYLRVLAAVERQRRKDRKHNCWDCAGTIDYCFNKRHIPKDSNEGYDCEDWI